MELFSAPPILTRATRVDAAGNPVGGAAAGAASTTISLTYSGPGATAASVEIEPGQVVLGPGGVATVAFKVLDDTGAVIAGVPVSWTSTAAGVATVDGGNVTGVSDGISEVVVTTPTGLQATSTVYVVSGTLAFVQDGVVRTRAPGGGDVAERGGAGAASAPAWSPDGTRLFFAEGGSVRLSGDGSPLFGGGWPSVSPDGKLLAFSAKTRGRDHLYIWDIEQNKQVQDLAFEGMVAMATPSFSPDGRRLVFSGSDQAGLTDLYLVDLEDESLHAISYDLYHDRDPDWSPDGQRIVFSSDRWKGGRHGLYNLFLYDVESEEILALSHGEHNDAQPRWSPDGSEIVFSSDRDTMYNIYSVRLESGNNDERAGTRRLTSVLTGAFDPVLSADGETLLFSGFQSGGFQIYELEMTVSDSAKVQWQAVTAASAEPWTLQGLHGESQIARRPYERKMGLDIAQSQISQDPEFGTSGGIQVALSDVLGNDQYYFVLSHIAGSRTEFFDGLNLALSRLHLGQRLNVSWGVFRLNDRFSSRFGRFVREKRTGAHIGLSYPFSRHDRIETRLSLRRSEIDRQFEGRRLNGWLANNFISYTHDSSLWVPTGPLEGKRYSIGLGQTVDFKTSRRFNITLFGDYRQYVRLSQRSAYAIRLIGRRSTGDVPEFFSIGGSWTLRGYPWRSIWGSKMILINQELRFPLVDRLLIGLPFGNMDFSAFRGAVFLDAGNAWNDDFDEWRGAFGVGARLALGGVFVFRIDGARRTDFKSVEGDTRWDFFFGWDF